MIEGFPYNFDLWWSQFERQTFYRRTNHFHPVWEKIEAINTYKKLLECDDYFCKASSIFYKRLTDTKINTFETNPSSPIPLNQTVKE